MTFKAKLCDFGLARNMTLGTQILTSIKGTPLYMAPELLEGRGYGHEADLWSLGCIIYEMLAGESPFNTRSILHLMQLIRYGNVKWPSFLSNTCISFLKGLLINNPANRMCWNEILAHDFVKGNNDDFCIQIFFNRVKIIFLGNILILSTDQLISDSPFTRPRGSSASLTNKKKSEMRKPPINPCEDLLSSIDSVKVNLQSDFEIETDIDEFSSPQEEREVKKIEAQLNFFNPHQFQKFEAVNNANVKPLGENSNMIMHRFMDNVDPELQQFLMSPPMMIHLPQQQQQQQQLPPPSQSQVKIESVKKSQKTHSEISTHASSVPVEVEEWSQFLFKSMQEILDGDLEFYKQENMMTMIVGLLRDSKYNTKIIQIVVEIICLPYAIDMPKSLIDEINRMYFKLKLVPNLVYASKLMCQKKLGAQVR